MWNKVPPPPSCVNHPFLIGGWAGGERIWRELHLSRHSLSQPCESHRTHADLQHTRTLERERAGGVEQEESSQCGERGTDVAKDRNLNFKEKTQEDSLFSPADLGITLGEGWQKGERERRRFSSCGR